MDSNSPETNGINKAMIAVVSVFILGLVIWGVASPEGLDNAMNATLGWVTTNLGWLFLVVVLFFVIAMIIVMISKWGRIRLGGDDAKPEYSTWAWFAMLFAAAMGIGLVFWGVSEPLCHYFSPSFALSKACLIA
jgi:choline-glycine betaine transporter